MAPNTTLFSIPPPTEINDTHKVYSIAVACIVLGVLASLTVILRLIQRVRSRAFGLDDYAIIPGLLFYIGWTIMAGYVNLHAGVGKPLWEITLGEFSVWYQGIIGSAWIYPPMTASIRISILLLYRRTFATQMPRLRLVIWFLLALQIAYLITFSILPGFICHPLNKAWTAILERETYCHDWYYYYTSVGLYSCSMAFDAILLVLPLYPIAQLQMPLRRRIGVAVIFMMGAGASVAAAYKLAVFVLQMKRITHINPKWLQYQLSRITPPQFDDYGHTFWIPSQVEATVALIGTSLPALRPLLAQGFKQLTLYTKSIGTKNSTETGVSGKSDTAPILHSAPVTKNTGEFDGIDMVSLDRESRSHDAYRLSH